jgi:hypothetical protein
MSPSKNCKVTKESGLSRHVSEEKEIGTASPLLSLSRSRAIMPWSNHQTMRQGNLCPSTHAYKEVIQKNNDGNNEKDMNKSSSKMKSQPTEQPENDENNHDSPKNTA